MKNRSKFHYNGEISWCPGCGDFQILKSLEKALIELEKPPWEIVLVSGIGQAAKLPHYIKANGFNGLHGRALPAAFGIKAANHNLTVIVTTGDGDCYGEGGNHLIHCIRRNIDITIIVFNNQIYGLTKGQASPTTDQGMVTNTQPYGVINYPFNAMSFAVAMDTAFVARSFSQDIEFTKELILQAIKHKGVSILEILQPCVSFNKKNSYGWYKERCYKLESSYDPNDRINAFSKSLEWGDKIPIGVLYKKKKPHYMEKVFNADEPPLVNRQLDHIDEEAVMAEFGI